MTSIRKNLRNHMWRNRSLPYGMWICENERQVLFNRDYKPIFERSPGIAPTPAVYEEWVSAVKKQEWFYYDGTPFAASVKAACAVLDGWGVEIPEIPQLSRTKPFWQT